MLFLAMFLTSMYSPYYMLQPTTNVDDTSQLDGASQLRQQGGVVGQLEKAL